MKYFANLLLEFLTPVLIMLSTISIVVTIISFTIALFNLLGYVLGYFTFESYWFIISFLGIVLAFGGLYGSYIISRYLNKKF